MDLHYLTLSEASQHLQLGEISSEELTRAILNRIEATEPKIHSFVTLTQERAVEQAREIDRRRLAGEELGPLAGVPCAVKDNFCTQGVRTTCSSKILGDFVPPYDGTVVAKLKEAGAIIIGKTNLDEFAMGSSVENSALFMTYNPWDTSCVPGGSSGGSASSVAAGQAIYSFGSDTGGSIRQPASFCGVVGLKPTYGRVSRYGLVAFASSLDQIGPFARTAADCAMILNVICGHDRLDSTSANVEVPDFSETLTGDCQGLRIGIPMEYFGEGIAPGVAERVSEAIEVLKSLGAEVDECSLPHTEHALSAYYIIAPAEASSNLARYDGVRYGYRALGGKDLIDLYGRTRDEGFGPEVKRRIIMGTYALSSGYYDAYYLKAQKVRTLVKRDFDRAFEKFDLIVAPTSPTVAFKVGEKKEDPLAMYMADICTIPVNLAGLPGISVPCGFAGGLPVGMQLIGRAFDEAALLRAADAFQGATDFHWKRPSL